MIIKNDATKICVFALGLIFANASFGENSTGRDSSRSSMGKDSTDIIPKSMQTLNITNIYHAPTHVGQPPVNGQCGSDNGVVVYVQPTGLCSKGNASSIIQSGNIYSWSCGGLFGGTSAMCSARQYVAPPPPPPPPPPTCQFDFGGPLPPCSFYQPAPPICVAGGWNIQWSNGMCGYKP